MHRVELKVIWFSNFSDGFYMFLMHRVELKVLSAFFPTRICFSVPNAPCGVERNVNFYTVLYLRVFLMHRVELKGIFSSPALRGLALFLMHRVELKDL